MSAAKGPSSGNKVIIAKILSRISWSIKNGVHAQICLNDIFIQTDKKDYDRFSLFFMFSYDPKHYM